MTIFLPQFCVGSGLGKQAYAVIVKNKTHELKQLNLMVSLKLLGSLIGELDQSKSI